jgi:4-diphosphocytidyl-2-C-methyl-D-erythritol kinase
MRARSIQHQCHEAAFAKVNLGLRVLRRRRDGYHEIRTVLQSIEFFDDVDVSLRMGGRRSVQLLCDREDLNNKGNLAWRAADLLLRRLRVNARVRVRLVKRIPVGAGLGGGSSDAAAVLRAISYMLRKPPPPDVLLDVASVLGSDVPYFLIGGTAVASGRGTEVTPVPELPAAWIALAFPDIEVSTAWAYRALAESRATELTSSAPGPRIVGTGWGSSPVDIAFERLSERMLNDFEGVVFRRYPTLKEIKRRILAHGARCALLSGSGSAVFGVFDSFQEASRASGALAAQGLRAQAVRFVTRADCGLGLEMDEEPAESDLRG